MFNAVEVNGSVRQFVIPGTSVMIIIMDNIKDLNVVECVNSKFVKPLRLKYKQNGISKEWDILDVHKSVVIVIFNITRKVFVLVKQFRPVTSGKIDTEKYPGSLGLTLEFCAGIVDKDLPLEEIAKIEVLEECGYDVPATSLVKIGTHRGGVGVSGDYQTAFYVEVTDEMKVSAGGGNVSEGELIDVIEMTIPELRNYISQREVTSPGGFLYLSYWFFAHHAIKYETIS